ncbi:glycosyltransferase, partial [Enterobacteriaceae bacterium ML5]
MAHYEPIRKVSVVIPVYNEEESLPALLTRTQAACQQLTQQYEIILVDDGSADSSGDMLAAAAEQPDSHIIA